MNSMRCTKGIKKITVRSTRAVQERWKLTDLLKFSEVQKKNGVEYVKYVGDSVSKTLKGIITSNP